ncbi:leucyl/phenylalanyl-tRNA--protein transferase [Breznakiellaceae bacterium SP9]
MKKHTRAGPDPAFPYLFENQRYHFPNPAEQEGSIVAVGGNLSPGMLLSAYEQGIFPWYNPNDPILWQSPDPRFIIYAGKLHISQSMKKVLKKGEYAVYFDHDFPAVIRECADIYRPGQGGTWITDDIITAYTKLHELGWAHCAESYLNGELVGGCYGVRLGPVFFGESMFSKRSNASKAAFLSLAQVLFNNDVAFIDCQVHTQHLKSLGGEELSREAFIDLLHKTLGKRTLPSPEQDQKDYRGKWELFVAEET